jgi:aromatic-L-amino-acid decarboxylase
MPGFELVSAADLSTIAFRAVDPQRSEGELDALNRTILERVNLRGRVHLSATTLRDRFTLRVCVLSFRSHAEHIDTCLNELSIAREELT